MSTLTVESTRMALRVRRSTTIFIAQETTDALNQYWWLCYVAYAIAMIFAKISIGFFLLRLTVRRSHIWIIRLAMAGSTIMGTIFFFVTVCQCMPLSYFWNKVYPTVHGTCININTVVGLTYLYSSINAICDFTFGILPFFLVWNLNMDRKTKIALIPILSMACMYATLSSLKYRCGLLTKSLVQVLPSSYAWPT